MPSVSFSCRQEVDDRLEEFRKETNKKLDKDTKLVSRADCIDYLLQKVGF